MDGKSAAVLLYAYSILLVSSAAVTAIKAQIEASNGNIKVRPSTFYLHLSKDVYTFNSLFFW